MICYVSQPVVLSLVGILCTSAHPTHFHNSRDHVDSFTRELPGQWYQPESHPVNALFKRASAPQPGTAEWAAQYPPAGSLPPNTIPQDWLDALHAAEEAGLIPNISIPTESNQLSPVYPQGQNPAGPEICSSTDKCRMPDDVWDGPAGTVAIGFDDGPYEGSALLYDFLEQNNIPSTHFMIGTNIVNNYDLFQRAFKELKADIAVHTWTHRYMTSLSNEVAMAELAWTMQIISDSTGGRVPKFWRPPYGDSDNRIRAIAKHVLGLTQINWNFDSQDWRIDTGAITLPAVKQSISGWYAGAKSPGLIILEHELNNDTSNAFISTFPGIAANGWKMASTVELLGGGWQNAEDNTGAVESMDIIAELSSTSTTSSSTQLNNAVASSTGSASSLVSTASTASVSPSVTAVPLSSNTNNNAGSPSIPRLNLSSSIIIIFSTIFLAFNL